MSQPLPFSQGATTLMQGENAELIEEVGRFEAIEELDPPGASTVNELGDSLEQARTNHPGNDLDLAINQKRRGPSG